MPGQLSEFSAGVNHQQAEGRFNQMSPGLAGDSDSWTSQVVSAASQPHSVLDPLAFSGEQSPNGSDASHWQPGMGSLGSGNGMSPDTFDQNLNLRFMGGDPNAETD